MVFRAAEDFTTIYLQKAWFLCKRGPIPTNLTGALNAVTLNTHLLAGLRNSRIIALHLLDKVSDLFRNGV